MRKNDYIKNKTTQTEAVSKKNIVIVVDSFDTYQSASGICAHLISKYLNHDNFSTHIFCRRFGVRDNDLVLKNDLFIHKTFYGVEDRLFAKHNWLYFTFRKVISKIRHIIFNKHWPINSPSYVKKTIKKINQLPFTPDLVLGISRFCDSLKIISSLDASIKKCSLNLDLLDDPTNPYKTNTYTKRVYGFMRNCYSRFYSNIFMDYHYDWVEKNKNNLNIKNIVYTGLPFYEPRVLEQNKAMRKSVLFAGTDAYINWEVYEKLVKSLPTYTFDHYGQITNKTKLKRLLTYSNFKYCGFASKSAIFSEENTHSHLLLFESNYRYSISSKSISYLSTNKPIICFCPNYKKDYYLSIGATTMFFCDCNMSPEELKNSIDAIEVNKANQIDYKKFSPLSICQIIENII